MELMLAIPEDVDPDFTRWVTSIGQLAWEYPEFREQLEILVTKADERLQ